MIFSWQLPTLANDTAPVVDITQQDADNQNNAMADQNNNVNDDTTMSDLSIPSMTQNMSSDQRLARVEQQIANMVQMNLPQQIADLQQTMQQLQGELQVQEHDLKLLNDQQRNFYQDLDRRISQLQNLAGNNNDNSKQDLSKASEHASLQLKDSDAYKAAFKLVTKQQYEPAKNALQRYLKNYSNGQFAANANYWLGEIHLSQQNYSQAQQAFNTVVTKFSHSPKAQDAKLKLAMVHIKMGHADKAKQELTQIKKHYPGSTAAQLATIQLQQLNP